jgi:hypothetical protein
MLRATDPGPEQPRAHRYAGRDHHPVVGSLGAGEDWSGWVVDQVGVEAIVRCVLEVPSGG